MYVYLFAVKTGTSMQPCNK